MRALAADDASEASLPRSVIMKRLVISSTWPITSSTSGCMNCSHMPWPVMSTKWVMSSSAATPAVTPAPMPALSRGSSAIR